MPKLARARSGLAALASLVAMIILAVSTNPVDNVIYSTIFFGLALVFMISLGFFLVRLQTGALSHKNRYRTVAISLLLIVLLMFRSARSLSWVDGIILVLIGFGLVFYISMRSSA
ncbi:MAG TPA: hypothetical protein VFJ84_00405 [Candidatus Saccharimonadales bacterium]|nr:hypothetical protein [Candidatus Saccharimonadales bacterium]